MPNIGSGNISKVQLAIQGSAPAAPATGNVRLYQKANGLHYIDANSIAYGPLALTSVDAAHTDSHKDGGVNAIKLDELAAPTDVTTLNANSTAHGLLMKLDGSAAKYLDGSGAWSTPSGLTPSAHAASHQNGGGDEISVAGLSGALADPQRTVRQFTFTVADALTAAAGKLRIYNYIGSTLTISGVYLAVNTAPTGAAIIVDVHKSGTTIFTTQSNRPQIAAGGNEGSSTTIENAALTNGAYLTVDVDQIGSTVAGSDLTVIIVAS